MIKYYVTTRIYTYSYIIDNIEILQNSRNQYMNLGNVYIGHTYTNYIRYKYKK